MDGALVVIYRLTNKTEKTNGAGHKIRRGGPHQLAGARQIKKGHIRRREESACIAGARQIKKEFGIEKS